mmetsp:Transcript_2368/g.4146  ORF Transcript_2368/g.4146 Transcript_2368/m.4146 type:complete len:201 (-) Transcript_2368:84-686(-)
MFPIAMTPKSARMMWMVQMNNGRYFGVIRSRETENKSYSGRLCRTATVKAPKIDANPWIGSNRKEGFCVIPNNNTQEKYVNVPDMIVLINIKIKYSVDPQMESDSNHFPINNSERIEINVAGNDVSKNANVNRFHKHIFPRVNPGINAKSEINDGPRNGRLLKTKLNASEITNTLVTFGTDTTAVRHVLMKSSILSTPRL